MRSRFAVAAFVLLASLVVLLVGCGRNEEQVAGGRSLEGDRASVTCEALCAEGECTVTCTDSEREETCKITCEHSDDGTCTITSGGETVICEHSADGECEAVCAGMEVTCEKNDDGTCTITCDGKTVSCDHASSGKCPRARATVTSSN